MLRKIYSPPVSCLLHTGHLPFQVGDYDADSGVWRKIAFLQVSGQTILSRLAAVLLKLKKMNLPKTILFDMDGTLVDNIPFHRDAWLTFLGKNGIHLNEAEFHAENHGTLTEMMARFFPHIKDPILLNEKGQEKESTYRDMYRSHIREIPGLTPLLQKLQHNKISAHVATMGDTPNIDFTLDTLGIRSYFSSVTGGHEVIKGKPDPEIFLLSMQKARVNPAECLVVEDSFGGVLAAISAGITVIGITTSQTALELMAAGCEGVIDDFYDLERILIEMENK